MIGGRRLSVDRELSAQEIALVAEQLWPGCSEPDFRVVVDADDSPGWVGVERHAILGRSGRIDLILPPYRRAAARALASYARLRPLRKRVGRSLLSAGIAGGVVRPHGSIRLERRSASPKPGATETVTVVQQLREAFGDEIFVAMHVRRSANRKALLQVLDRGGRTLGFAKVARDATSTVGIANEIAALEALDGGTSTMRVPRVLLHGSSGGLPFLVTEPLPEDLRGLSPALRETPSIAEFAAVAPVARWARPAKSGHFARLGSRLQGPAMDAASDRVRRLLSGLLPAIEGTDAPMPIGQWWHGDFAFWNTGRSPSGQLWCWDFENVEMDALAGLDAIHWHASRRRAAGGAAGLSDRAGILADAAPVLSALGVGGAAAQRVLYRVYLAEIAVRTLEMVSSDGWARVWCTPRELESVIAAALVD